MIRAYRPADREALYRVCLKTGDSGQDATSRYDDPLLLGHVFVGPYLALQPEYAFVVDDGAGAEGYVLGALDSLAFARECERTWWPALREAYRDVTAASGRADVWPLELIRHPREQPRAVLTAYPSHLHIDLLPRWQGGGWGRLLIRRVCDALAAAGSPGVHLGVSARNVRAIGFYRHLGFRELDSSQNGVLMGLQLGTGQSLP